MKDYAGFGALSEALQSLSEQDFRKVLVVASESGWRRFNIPAERTFFTERETRVFTAFSPNPDFAEILAGASLFREFNPDLIVAFGGGSPIDVAKTIKAEVFTKQPYDSGEPQSIVPSGDGPPLVAITTTAGSGSEATQFSVFYVGHKKQALSHPSLRPDMAVVDPEMTYSLPPAQTAATGFDALSQAIEAYWSTNSTTEAKELGKVAIGYILPNLYNAVHTPQPGNRYHMAQAAYLSGQAINMTRTSIPHALAYYLTQEYGLAHGHAVAITLPYFFRLNIDPALPVNVKDGAAANRQTMEELFALLGLKDAEGCFIFWRNLMHACGLASRLSEVGVDDRQKVQALVGSMDPMKLQNHPVQIKPEYLVDFIVNNP